jgi:predicted CXXCH cytochrome family protein
MDGEQESFETYGLCYRCHDREKVLASPLFPEHYLHVVDRQVSCATCHDAHGSIENRALIRFGNTRIVTGVSPSASLDVLAFDSTMPGSGSCYLTCHGYDHAPAHYGGGEFEVLGTRGDSPRQHRIEGLRQPRRGRSGRSEKPPGR